MERINLLATGQSQAAPKPEGLVAPVWALVGLSLLLLGGLAGAWTHLRALDLGVAEQQAELASLESERARQSELAIEALDAEAQYAALARVQNPLAPAATIALLSQVLPEELSLTELIIETTPALPPRSAGRTDTSPAAEATAVSLRMSGWAEDEIAVVRALERMNQTGVLGEARLVYARPDHEGGQSRQAFIIEAMHRWPLAEAE